LVCSSLRALERRPSTNAMIGRASKRVGRSAALVAAAKNAPRLPQVLSKPASLRPLTTSRKVAAAAAANITAPQAEPPFKTVIIYNQSKHSCQSVLADIRAVWGNKIGVIQCLEEGLQRLPNVDGTLYLKPKMWGDMAHFEERLNWLCSQDHGLHHCRAEREVVFMPGWSAFAESAEAAVAVEKLGLVWPGTEPTASVRLEKIGFKRICESVGAPTPPFTVLAEEDSGHNLNDPAAKEECVQSFMKSIADMNTAEPGLIKSIHGGGGKGTAHLPNPSCPDSTRAAVEQVLNEMGRSDGIYFELKVNQKGDGRFYQLELEVDGEVCAQGGRFVWFNNRLQKVVEIGLSDDLVPMFMPADLYEKSRKWAQDVAKAGGNNTRGTMEALVFENEKGEHEIQFIECNRRPQVENEALALLQRDSDGNRRYTFAELMMRAKGYPAPEFGLSPADTKVVLHARWLHGNPDSTGNITYQAGKVLGMTGPRLDFLPAELMAPGEISFTSDPQLGKAVITAKSWDQMCERAVTYFTSRRPNVLGSTSTYAQTMENLFSHPLFREGKIASNETFKYLEIPEHGTRGMLNILQDQVTPVMVNGYRPGEGIDPDRYPTNRVMETVSDIHKSLSQTAPRATAFTKFARGEASYESYIADLRGQLSNQGGAWVTVAPRDTAQQGNDSESASVSSISRRNAEVWAEQAGCIGYETGGAQYQAGLIRGFDPAAILCLGLPYNMPAHSLQRSQYANGLAELTPEIRKALFESTAGLVSNHYRRGLDGCKEAVPWHPYNFHAGNYFDPKTNYSPQDETTNELLAAKTVPMPNWVFSPKFSLEALEGWTNRQIDIFAAHGQPLQALRMKNPGQGKDWTVDAIWAHVSTVLKVFKERKMDPPVFYLHNHDFNGLGGHIGQGILSKAQSEGFNNMVIDAGYRKNGTHNDNTVVADSLHMSAEQYEALVEYNHVQQQIEQALVRFDSRTSQMTPWDSDWAGGTEGSDIRIAKEYKIDPRKINHAKEVATEVFPLERAVTPFSEYKLRLGIAIMIEDAIEPKSADKVREWVSNGGKLKVGGDVLVGLHRWETLVAKTPYVDMLLKNMPEELEAALGAKGKLIGPGDLPAGLTQGQVNTALGYQQKGLDFATSQAKGTDLSPLLCAPHILHAAPLSVKKGTRFEVVHQAENVMQREMIQFDGFGYAPNGDILANFQHEGQQIAVQIADPNASVGANADSGPRKASGNNELGCAVPGEVLLYNVKVGDILKEGAPLCVLESMKMEMKISVPAELDGMVVANLPCNQRTKEKQGDLLAPGDLLLELKDPE